MVARALVRGAKSTRPAGRPGARASSTSVPEPERAGPGSVRGRVSRKLEKKTILYASYYAYAHTMIASMHSIVPPRQQGSNN